MTQSWTAADIPRLAGRVVLVTGANSGIGFETARELVHKRALVVLACRDDEKAAAAADRMVEACPSAKVETLRVDLADLASVRSAARRFGEAHGRLDVLINNAGIMGTPARHSADGYELQFATNHLGHFTLTGLLLEMLLATPSSRVVTVSSVGHRLARIDLDDLHFARRRYRRFRAYGNSKLANLHHRPATSGLCGSFVPMEGEIRTTLGARHHRCRPHCRRPSPHRDTGNGAPQVTWVPRESRTPP